MPVYAVVWVLTSFFRLELNCSVMFNRGRAGVGEVMLPRPLLFWESPSDAGSSLCLNEVLGSRLIVSNTQCPGNTSESQTLEWMTKCFSVPWKVQTAFLFAAPPLTACGGFVYVRLSKEKKKIYMLSQSWTDKSRGRFTWVQIKGLVLLDSSSVSWI